MDNSISMGEQEVREHEAMTFGMYQDNALFKRMLDLGFEEVTAVYAHWTVANGVEMTWAFRHPRLDLVVLNELVRRDHLLWSEGRYTNQERLLTSNEFEAHISRPNCSTGANYDLKAMLGDYDPSKPSRLPALF